MANKTMHHVVIGSDTYEIVDEQGRAKAATNTQDITALKEDLSEITGLSTIKINTLMNFCKNVAMKTDDTGYLEALISAWTSEEPIHATGITIDEAITVDALTTIGLNVVVTPSNTTDTVTFVSSDPEVADVDTFGNVTGKDKIGTATITATVNGHSATCTVTNDYPAITFLHGAGIGYYAASNLVDFGNANTARIAGVLSGPVGDAVEISDTKNLFTDTYYLMFIPEGKTQITVTSPGLIAGLQTFKVSNGQNLRVTDIGWKSLNSSTHDLSSDISNGAEYIAVNFKNSSNTSIANYDISQLSISWA